VTWTSALRLAAFARLPKSWQPAATYYYYRARSVLEPELPIICRSLQPGMRAVDVGANEGVYTHAFARTGAIVESFEPQPQCLDILRSYARRHPHVHVHGEALGADESWATLHVPEVDGRLVTGHASLAAPRDLAAQFRVRVRTLDSFAFDHVAVVKIDVEGHELDVLRGARETIRRCQPTLLVEIEQRHLQEPMERVFDEVMELGYRGNFLDRDGSLRSLAEFDRRVHQLTADADVPHAPYVNNFIFAPTGQPRRALVR
jgi:FkbM family methyltransferase